MASRAGEGAGAAAGTTQGDLLVPGFASMVHGLLGGGSAEVLWPACGLLRPAMHDGGDD